MAGPVPYREFWDFLVSMSADFDKLVGELPEDRRADLRADVESRIGPYFSAGIAGFPAEAHIVVAHRPGAG